MAFIFDRISAFTEDPYDVLEKPYIPKGISEEGLRAGQSNKGVGLNEETLNTLIRLTQKIMNDTSTKGEKAKEQANSKEQNDNDNNEKNNAEYEQLVEKLNKMDKTSQNQLLKYLIQRDSPPTQTAVNTRQHFIDARHSREERQARLQASMELGKYNRRQMLLEQLDRRNAVRDKIIRQQNISSRGTAMANVFPQNPIYQSSIGNV